MLTDYVAKQLERAEYKILEDRTIFGEIPKLKGVWASAKTVEACRNELREVLEEWLLLKIQSRETIVGLKSPSDRSDLVAHA